MGEPLERRLTTLHGVHRMTLSLEDHLEQFGELRLIVDHEDPGHGVSAARARGMAPVRPGRLVLRHVRARSSCQTLSQAECIRMTRPSGYV